MPRPTGAGNAFLAFEKFATSDMKPEERRTAASIVAAFGGTRYVRGSATARLGWNHRITAGLGDLPFNFLVRACGCDDDPLSPVSRSRLQNAKLRPAQRRQANGNWARSRLAIRRWSRVSIRLDKADQLLCYMGQAPIGPDFVSEVEAFLSDTGIGDRRFGSDAAGCRRFSKSAGSWRKTALFSGRICSLMRRDHDFLRLEGRDRIPSGTGQAWGG